MGVIRPWVLLRRAAPLLAPARHLASPTSDNLLCALAATAHRRRDHTLLHLPRDCKTAVFQPESRVSYAAFWALVRRYAGSLRRLGLQKGHRLAAQSRTSLEVSKRPENVALYLATLQVGAIYLPLNTDYTFEEIRYFLWNSRPSLFVCKDAMVGDYLRTAQEAPHGTANGNHAPDTYTDPQIVGEVELGRLAVESEPVEDICEVDASDVASISYTSGTTGKPKGAMITHGNLLSNARTLVSYWDMRESDSLLHALPIYHVHGLFVALNSSLLAGGSIVFLPRFELGSVLEWLPRCTVMMGVPTYYTRLLHSPDFAPALLPGFRLFISGSAPLLASVWEEFRERSGGHRILERYGMTEGQMVCSNPVDGDRVPETVGFPLPGVQARVRDGVLQYKGPNVFRGYWGMPEKTAAEFTEDGWFISGDLASMEDDGRVRILGRGKDLIISGGLNVYPKEVEDVLDAWEGVSESAVVGVPHPDWGEVGVAAVVPRHPSTPIDVPGLLAYARTELAGFKVTTCPRDW